LVAIGEPDEARPLFEVLARDDFRKIHRSIRWAGTIDEAAHLCADLDDAPRAEILLDYLGRNRDLHGMLPMPIDYNGPIAHCLARLNACIGWADEARSLFEEALAAAEAIGARPTMARIALDAAPLMVRGGNLERARTLLELSARLAGEIGMVGVEEDAGRKLASIGNSAS
jgi:hypothetical protein